MTATAGRVAAAADHSLLPAYLEHCQRLGLSDRASRDRLRIARDFLTAHPDVHAWMRLPTQHRVLELRRTGAWPLLVFAIGTGQVALDVELATSKHLQGLGAIVEDRHRVDFAAARGAGLAVRWTDGWVEIVLHECLAVRWTDGWVETVLHECLAVVLAWHAGPLSTLNTVVLQRFQHELEDTPTVPPSSLRAYRARLASLRQLLFQLGLLDDPARRRPWGRTLEQRFDDVEMAPTIRETLLRYVHIRAAVLRPKSVESLVNDLLPFAEYLTTYHRDVASLRHLRRHHVEQFPSWNKTRPWRGRRARHRPIGAAVAQSTVLTLRNMLEDITAWGWAEAPTRRLVFATDIPKLDRALPRALPPGRRRRADGRRRPPGRPVRPHRPAGPARHRPAGRGTARPRAKRGDRLWADRDLAAGPARQARHRTFRAPDAATLAVLDQWATCRGAHRPLPHPRTGKPTDFLFTEHGRRLGATRLRNGLLAAVATADLRGPGGQALTVTPHQLRHTYATTLASAGMSLQAALLGHVTPEMTIRYATLASPTLRSAYDQAIGTMRRQLTLTPVGRPIIPDKIAWLAAEMLKTRVAHGYCLRHESQGACPTRTSVKPATTSPLQPNSPQRWPTSSPTSTPCRPWQVSNRSYLCEGSMAFIDAEPTDPQPLTITQEVTTTKLIAS